MNRVKVLGLSVFRHDWIQIDREWRSSKRAVLAYYVGGWREGESPLEALARALGVASEDLPLDSIDPTIERDELDQLSACLGAGWVEGAGLNIEDSVALAISLLNEKLAFVPYEVRAFFDAPGKLGPLPGRAPPAVSHRLN